MTFTRYFSIRWLVLTCLWFSGVLFLGQTMPDWLTDGGGVMVESQKWEWEVCECAKDEGDIPPIHWMHFFFVLTQLFCVKPYLLTTQIVVLATFPFSGRLLRVYSWIGRNCCFHNCLVRDFGNHLKL